MAASLTPQDVTRLLSEPSAETRAELAGKVAAELARTELTKAEAAVAKDIIRIMARAIEAQVRASVAKGLRHSRNLPHDVALKLAEDIDSIAMPLLTDSLVLTDDDLATIVRQGPPASRKRSRRGRT